MVTSLVKAWKIESISLDSSKDFIMPGTPILSEASMMKHVLSPVFLNSRSIAV